MYHALSVLLVGVGLVSSRDTSKAFRSMPAISNSLVNLGKMDISFHFNTKNPDSQASSLKNDHFTHSVSPFFVPRPEPFIQQQTVEIEPCPCSSLKNYRNPFVSNSPTDVLGKILKSNDLFSFNQEPIVSNMCCDSHEHIQEDTVYFDFNPKTNAESSLQPAVLPSFPLVLDALLPKLQSPTATNSKSKAIEIFFFPKNKDGLLDFSKLSAPKDKKSKKSEIQIVGDKELKNEFKNMKYRSTFPLYSNKGTDLVEKQRERADKKVEKEEMRADDRQNERQENRRETTVEESMGKSTPAPFTPTPSASPPHLL